MQRLLMVLTLLMFVGCDEPTLTIDLGLGPVVPISIPNQDYDYPGYELERPTVNLETAFRQSNWLGSRRQGSCVHSTMVMLFRWQGQFEMADYWKKTFGDGEYSSGLAVKMDRAGVRYAYTASRNDVSFLEWACDTRRGCGVAVNNGRHMVMLVGLDDEYAGILDNNSIGNFKWIKRETFLADWRRSGSWAVVPICGTVPPPLPFD